MRKRPGPRYTPEFFDSARLHEIRNHLTALSVSAQMFPKKRRDPAFLDSLERLLVRETGRLQELLDSLVARERPNLEPLTRIEWGGLRDRTIELMVPLARSRRIELEVGKAPVIRLWGRVCQLESLVLNLVRNAIEAAGPRGKVRVTSRLEGPFLDLQVWNNGKPIPRECMGEIFKPYFTTKKGGMGMGLAICRWVAEQHGGRIEVSSSKAGTVFQVLLPTGKGKTKASKPN